LNWQKSKRGQIFFGIMKRILVILVVLCCTLTIGQSQSVSYNGAIYAPQPKYPDAALRHGWAGSGLFLFKLRPNGTVSSVTVLKSTGHDVLDQSGIAAFQQWRFKPGQGKSVEIPLNFLMRRGVRSRMAGAALDRSY
jgi:TonB family protein